MLGSLASLNADPTISSLFTKKNPESTAAPLADEPYQHAQVGALFFCFVLDLIWLMLLSDDPRPNWLDFSGTPNNYQTLRHIALKAT
ncbi:MAG: hypothetical protein QOE55_8558 [Acidobacteriaceae bacterium]|nr:hypothetical protein [Acidobacteriaceae bacterium]